MNERLLAKAFLISKGFNATLNGCLSSPDPYWALDELTILLKTFTANMMSKEVKQ